MVKYNLQDIATVSGKGGLFRVIKPTRSGVIIESLDEDKKRLMIQTRHKISLLQEISIFTTGEEGSLALDKVFSSVYENFKDELNIKSDAPESDFQQFMSKILPNYDSERVYVSDMKKLVTWYGIINKYAPPKIEEKTKKEPVKKAENKTENLEEKPKVKATAKKTKSKEEKTLK